MSISDNEKCLLTILARASREMSTAELIEAMDEFPDLCKGCKSGTYLIRTAMNLVRKGMVKRKAGKGGFYWNLVKKVSP
ncbi:MAG: hypothetical protein D6732_05980 [Methanobacteriota archaeon]|nr:MAG: hypothetical protein D6732_05980 [Euryarchaeota archaeon]